MPENREVKLYTNSYPPELDGGMVYFYLDNELLGEITISRPDLMAEKAIDSTVSSSDEFEDQLGNIFYCGVYSSYAEVYIEVTALLNSKGLENDIEEMKSKFNVEIESYDSNTENNVRYSLTHDEMSEGLADFNTFAIRYSRKPNIDELYQQNQSEFKGEVSIGDLSTHFSDVKPGDLAIIIAGGRAGDTNKHGQGIYCILQIDSVGKKGIAKKSNYSITGHFIYFFRPFLEKSKLLEYSEMASFPYIGNTHMSPAMSSLSREDIHNLIITATQISNIPKQVFTRFFPWLKRPLVAGGNISKNSIDNFPVVLDVDKIAAVFGEYVINHKADDVSAMIGIFGKWGRGKTTFYNEVQKYIDIQTTGLTHITCKFQPWKYHKREEAWAYLYQVIYEKYLSDGYYFRNMIRLSAHRLGWARPILFGVGIVLAIGWSLVAIEDKLNIAFSLFSILGFSGAIVLYKVYKILDSSKHQAMSLFHDYMKFDGFKDVLGFQNSIQEELKLLLKVFLPDPEKKKILLFVDDLDRCDEKMIIDTIDTLRLMLDDDEIRIRIKVVTAIDERILEKAVRHKYASKMKSIISTKEYIEKFFLVGLKLNRLSGKNIKELIKKYSSEVNDKNMTGSFPEDNKNRNEDETVETDENNEESKNLLVPVDSNSLVNSFTEDQKIIDKSLTDQEEAYLYEKIVAIDEPTPRKINIFIHRYLLFKALAYELFGAVRYSRLEKELFIELIFSINDGSKYDKYKTQCSVDKIMIDNPVEGFEDTKIQKDEFVLLMQIAEMVSPF